jgi:hypothetical protein
MDWLQTWDPQTANDMRRDGGRLEHTGSNQFMERGIMPGDRLFIAYIGDDDPNPKGRLFLVGRLVAASPSDLGLAAGERGWLTKAEASKVLGVADFWDAKFHVIARDATASLREFDREVEPALLPALRFLVRDGSDWAHSYLKLQPDGALKQQTLRRVRRLHPESAQHLERFVHDR